MNNDKKIDKKLNKINKSKNNIITTASIFLVLIIGLIIMKLNKQDQENIVSNLVIPKKQITNSVRFLPMKIGGKNMEILAVRASDGSIRTAFNTCQVCNGSPRAYYKQEGDVIVCQNCGNRFKMDMIEQQRGGCNPIPIMKEDKIEDNKDITISKDFIEKNKDLFTANWKTQ